MFDGVLKSLLNKPALAAEMVPTLLDTLGIKLPNVPKELWTFAATAIDKFRKGDEPGALRLLAMGFQVGAERIPSVRWRLIGSRLATALSDVANDIEKQLITITKEASDVATDGGTSYGDNGDIPAFLRTDNPDRT